ncbi:integrating conjugative element protein [Caviibacterium pharyngocola]|uniref:Integrating conjugative element protein n=1 Tax=Caviibacterium pharyngocola TaxID=28159 RepID=A0A2M8RV42_9PAST|nr:integrating conjugative element protein [Caviibacterium pharyngocola]PJG82772.1 integrating conjugative element protein [Caviibacterium pharyngocola]
MKLSKWIMLTTLCIYFCHFSYAELQVIADLGGESAVRFYEGIQPEHDENATPHPNALPAQITEADMLPIISHQLTPGTVQSRTLDLAGMQPIFLVGYDSISFHWLELNATKLKNLNAVGLVVNVKDLDELMQLRAVVPELTLLPSSADDLAERIQLFHYPVLMTATGLSQ